MKVMRWAYGITPGRLRGMFYRAWIYILPRWRLIRHSDESAIRARFRKRLGEEPNLESPKTYNEKLQWLKLNWRDDLARTCADKFLLRSYVEERVGEKYLVPLLHVYEDPSNIDLSILPKKFALKASHGSGYNLICRDKSKIDLKEAERQCRSWMRVPYWANNREWVYKGLKPRLVVEELMLDERGRVPKDFKVFCFFGEPFMIQVNNDRFERLTLDFYDMEWKRLSFSLKHPTSDYVIKDVPPIKEMSEVSRILSAPFPHVRVDFYWVNGELKIGELTYFPASGFGRITPKEFDRTLGDLLDIPKMKLLWPESFPGK